MAGNPFKGRDFLSLTDYTREEIEFLLQTALELKRRFRTGEPHRLLQDKTLFMLFFNPSLRTRNSFEAGMTQLGGHAHFLEPGSMYTPVSTAREAVETHGERISDVARVLSRIGHGIAIRCCDKAVDWVYPRGQEIMENFAEWADVPVFNMISDRFHPCQVLGDLLTVYEKFGRLEGLKLVMSWAYAGARNKSRGVPQAMIPAATLFGMNVVLAHPEGLELDDDVVAEAQANAEASGGSFEISYDMESAFQDAHVVYPKSWLAKQFFPPVTETPEFGEAQRLYEQYGNWICDERKMDLTHQRAVYMHCLPADPGLEVTEAVMDGPQSVIFDQAENRLHAQKAVMALSMQ
jgi:N-acetylornithine carbamoyltransferase